MPLQPVSVARVDVSQLLPNQKEVAVASTMPDAVTQQPVRKDQAYLRVASSDPRLAGMDLPIAGLDGLPKTGDLFPGAPRAYRHGWHEGIDFYPEGAWNSVVQWGTPVRAVKDGVIDGLTATTFREMSPSEHAYYLEQSQALGFTPMQALIKLRGRTVWLDHGAGFKSVYAHLSALAPGLLPGGRVAKGQVIGYVGNSGTTNGVKGNRQDFHLHFEMWLDGRIAGFQWTQGDFARIWRLQDRGKRS